MARAGGGSKAAPPAAVKRIQDKSRKENDEFNRSSASVILFDLGRGNSLEDISEAGDVSRPRSFSARPVMETRGPWLRS